MINTVITASAFTVIVMMTIFPPLNEAVFRLSSKYILIYSILGLKQLLDSENTTLYALPQTPFTCEDVSE